MAGACGTPAALRVLVDALCSETNESSRRAGSHGLGSAGDASVPFLLEVLRASDLSPLVVGYAVDALGEAAVTPNITVVKCLSAVCVAQHDAITAARLTSPPDHLPEFEAGVSRFHNVNKYVECWETETMMCVCRLSQGMVSHRNDQLQVPIMLPIECRPLAARYLVQALVQIALGRLADRWAVVDNAQLYRAEILAALKPWSRNECPRVRKEQGRAIFQLSAALAGAAETGNIDVESLGAEAKVLRDVVQAGSYSVVKGEVENMPARDQSLAMLDRIAGSHSQSNTQEKRTNHKNVDELILHTPTFTTPNGRASSMGL